MKPWFLVAAALVLPGCSDQIADHATITNVGSEAVELHILFSSVDGDVVREETRSLGRGESYEFPLDHPRDGDYRLVVEAEDGRAAEMTLSWQGSTGPGRVLFDVYDDRIDEEQLVT